MASVGRSRWALVKALYWRPAAGAVAFLYGAVVVSQFLAANFGSDNFSKGLRLGNNIPHWSALTWAVVGLVLALVLSIEGAFREIRRLERAHEKAEQPATPRAPVKVWGIESVGDPLLSGGLIRAEIKNIGDQGAFGANLESLSGPGEPFLDVHLQLRWMNHDTVIINETIPPRHKRTIGVGTLTVEKIGRDIQRLRFTPMTPSGPSPRSCHLGEGATTIDVQITEVTGAEGYSKTLGIVVEWEPFRPPRIGWGSPVTVDSYGDEK